ncbi:uracil-DNA glycosylase [Xanthomonas sp. WHRI 8932A]|uniref:uracil-DNA glycosylase n=1 Tax=unclassified Xanthomonas TaxID=2643310 RepID=UPI002B236B6A|nr:uracil-DNA glycosylase [Xanthomonas sp. WHRI 8932A]MEA9566839.1 uracil-DNA glycosylase [Xanthomonas sp. WHRI 8932A]
MKKNLSPQSAAKLIEINNFVDSVSSFEMPRVFNPYRDSCPVHDDSKSALLRRENLKNYLVSAFEKNPECLWVGRDLGYRGGRRTGIPLTDEPHLSALAQVFPSLNLSKATRTNLVVERTAAEIWRVISRLDEAPFLWNIFPFHPFDSADPMGNRCHTRDEYKECAWILERLLGIFNFKKVFSLGNDAARVFRKYDIEMVCVRHPSYGGQNEFRRTMEIEYGTKCRSSQSELF